MIPEADGRERDWDWGGVEGRSVETGCDAEELEVLCFESFL